MVPIRKFWIICMSQPKSGELIWLVYLFVHILNFFKWHNTTWKRNIKRNWNFDVFLSHCKSYQSLGTKRNASTLFILRLKGDVGGKRCLWCISVHFNTETRVSLQEYGSAARASNWKLCLWLQWMKFTTSQQIQRSQT